MESDLSCLGEPRRALMESAKKCGAIRQRMPRSRVSCPVHGSGGTLLTLANCLSTTVSITLSTIPVEAPDCHSGVGGRLWVRWPYLRTNPALPHTFWHSPVTGGWLRVLGYLDLYPEPPEARALEVAPEGSVSPADAESIRLGDAERAFLDKLKGLLEPGEDTTLAGLNRRALGLAEENLRLLGFLETYIPPSASKALRKQQPTPKEAKLGR